MAKRKADELAADGKETKTATATAVEPLDDTLPPTKKAKVEKKFADQIIIKHQPANGADTEPWKTHTTSYYTLKHHCTHGSFEADTIPDPPEIIVTVSEPFGYMEAFLELAVEQPRQWRVFAMGRKVFTVDSHGVQFIDKNAACNLLAAIPWAIYFGHTQLITSLIGDVINIAVHTDAFEKEELFAVGKRTCMDALLHLASRLDHGDYYHELLVILNDSAEMKAKLRNPELSIPYGKVFRDMQICNMSNAPKAVKDHHTCHLCNKSVPLWAEAVYVEMALAATGKTDWDDIRAKKIASIKSCKDHGRLD
jgi:hypothetical protein